MYFNRPIQFVDLLHAALASIRSKYDLLHKRFPDFSISAVVIHILFDAHDNNTPSAYIALLTSTAFCSSDSEVLYVVVGALDNVARGTACSCDDGPKITLC
jgi:hypothetical protein